MTRNQKTPLPVLRYSNAVVLYLYHNSFIMYRLLSSITSNRTRPQERLLAQLLTMMTSIKSLSIMIFIDHVTFGVKFLEAGLSSTKKKWPNA